jgi:hypothetical protein
MKWFFSFFVSFIFTSNLISCATVPQDTVKSIDGKPEISKTLEAQDPNAPKGETLFYKH